MPKKTIDQELNDLLLQYSKKDISEQVVREVFIRDILNVFENAQKSKKSGATVMTHQASAYDPKTDKVKVRPKAV